MDAERWKRIDELLQAALRLPVEQQDEFLRRQCGNDNELLEEVRSLLTSHRQAGSFLEPPAFSPADMPTQTEDSATIAVTFRSMVRRDRFSLSRAEPARQRRHGSCV